MQIIIIYLQEIPFSKITSSIRSVISLTLSTKNNPLPKRTGLLFAPTCADVHSLVLSARERPYIKIHCILDMLTMASLGLQADTHALDLLSYSVMVG